MKLSGHGAENIAAFWAEFETVSHYQVLLMEAKVPTCIVTRTGDKPVGAQFRSKNSSGTLLLLPDIDFYPENFIKEKAGKQHWTPAANQFAARMVGAIVALDKALRSSAEVTPEPAWAASANYKLETESRLRLDLLEAEQRLEVAQRHKESIVEELLSAGTLRGLLFEKGKILEKSVIEALRILGFSATPFYDSTSEFDVVFESEEGRLIGEAEGKDTKAVNIEKLRQLSMNIHEDLQREDITKPAKPVLFGNAFRLQALDQRADPFTEKCHSAAASSSTALVFTPDLFFPVQYLTSKIDEEYARGCRIALLSTTGRVVFPTPLVESILQEVTQADEESDTTT